MDSENSSYIDAGAYSPGNGVILFFSGTALTIYDLALDKVEPTEWYEFENIDPVEAAVSWDDDFILLFQGEKFSTLKVSEMAFEGESQQWVGLPEEWEGTLDAAVRWSEDQVMFLKNDEYVIYSFSEEAYISYDYITAWEGWPTQWETGLECAFNVGGDIYFLNDGEVALYSTTEQTFYQTTSIGFEK